MLSETFLAGVAGVGPLFFLFMAIQQAIHRDISIDSGRCSTSVERIAHPIIAEWTTVTIVLSLLLSMCDMDSDAMLGTGNALGNAQSP